MIQTEDTIVVGMPKTGTTCLRQSCHRAYGRAKRFLAQHSGYWELEQHELPYGIRRVAGSIRNPPQWYCSMYFMMLSNARQKRGMELIFGHEPGLNEFVEAACQGKEVSASTLAYSHDHDWFKEETRGDGFYTRWVKNCYLRRSDIASNRMICAPLMFDLSEIDRFLGFIGIGDQAQPSNTGELRDGVSRDYSKLLHPDVVAMIYDLEDDVCSYFGYVGFEPATSGTIFTEEKCIGGSRTGLPLSYGQEKLESR